VIELFVTIVGIVSLILAFFLLLISTTANIKENLWEFGVLRAVGLSQEQSRRVFMYEAFAVIFAALVLGIVVGLTIAITLTAQFYLFIELPFKLAVSIHEQLTFSLVPNNAFRLYDRNVIGDNLLRSLDPRERCQ
jgi:ABC-type antimicrobial peptide transport system permease subunit